MKVKCELNDYTDRDKAFDSPRVIVTDAWADQDMVVITIGDKSIKVLADELRRAISNCSMLP